MQNQEALKMYNANMDSVKTMLTRLTKELETRFPKNDQPVNWGHVGDLVSIQEELKIICDRIFKEGEYAQ